MDEYKVFAHSVFAGEFPPQQPRPVSVVTKFYVQGINLTKWETLEEFDTYDKASAYYESRRFAHNFTRYRLIRTDTALIGEIN